jgi:hypothetical protein
VQQLLLLRFLADGENGNVDVFNLLNFRGQNLMFEIFKRAPFDYIIYKLSIDPIFTSIYFTLFCVVLTELVALNLKTASGRMKVKIRITCYSVLLLLLILLNVLMYKVRVI